MLIVAICASDREEYELKVDTLKQILRSIGGGMFSNLRDPQSTYWAMRAMNVLRRRLGLRGLARLAFGPAASALLGGSCEEYGDWQQRVKAVSDPRSASEASFYVDPDYVSRRARARRAPARRSRSSSTRSGRRRTQALTWAVSGREIGETTQR